MGSLKYISNLYPGKLIESLLAKDVNNIGTGLLKTICDWVLWCMKRTVVNQPEGTLLPVGSKIKGGRCLLFSVYSPCKHFISAMRGWGFCLSGQSNYWCPHHLVPLCVFGPFLNLSWWLTQINYEAFGEEWYHTLLLGTCRTLLSRFGKVTMKPGEVISGNIHSDVFIGLSTNRSDCYSAS